MRPKQKYMILIFVFFLSICITLFFAAWGDKSKMKGKPTEQFIFKRMENKNGTLATYLQKSNNEDQDLVKGREALSESLGLWLQYAIETKDRALFQKGFKILNEYFLQSDGFIYWKISPTGKKTTAANALIDDLRMTEVLFQADSLWDDKSYRAAALKISRFLNAYNNREDVLVDYYDRNTKENSNTITLSYIDPDALKQMKSHGAISQKVYNNMIELLKDMPVRQGFYAKSYEVNTKQFKDDENINMIDQALIALHQAEAGIPTAVFYQFIKKEYDKNHLIYGMYDRQSKQPSVQYESPALYGICILYLLEEGRRQFAKSLYNRMIQFRVTNPASRNYGAYSLNVKGDTHIFDNLLPLLAEEHLMKDGLLSKKESQSDQH